MVARVIEDSGDAIRLFLKKGGILKFHTRGNMNCIEAIHVPLDHANADLAPAKSPVHSNQTVDVNLFHAA